MYLVIELQDSRSEELKDVYFYEYSLEQFFKELFIEYNSEKDLLDKNKIKKWISYTINRFKKDAYGNVIKIFEVNDKKLKKIDFDEKIIEKYLKQKSFKLEEYLKKTSKKKEIKPKRFYTLDIEYMLGDVDGNEERSAEISSDNPFLEPLMDSFKKLKQEDKDYYEENKDFKEYNLEQNFKKHNISKFQFELLSLLRNDLYTDNELKTFLKKNKYEVNDKMINYLQEFADLIIDGYGDHEAFIKNIKLS